MPWDRVCCNSPAPQAPSVIQFDTARLRTSSNTAAQPSRIASAVRVLIGFTFGTCAVFLYADGAPPKQPRHVVRIYEFPTRVPVENARQRPVEGKQGELEIIARQRFPPSRSRREQLDVLGAQRRSVKIAAAVEEHPLPRIEAVNEIAAPHVRTEEPRRRAGGR